MIEQVNSEQYIIDHWTFGGGTAMMLQIDHRESRDIDIFLPDAQFLAFLDPQKRDFDLEVSASDYKGDGTHFQKLAFETGEIDFIVGRALTSSPVVKATVEGRAVLLETIPEIIAKKIYHRGTSIMPRDIFDIAAGAEKHEDSIVSELRAYRDAVTRALVAIDRQNPAFVDTAIAQLSIKEPYLAVAEVAREKAIEILRSV